MAADRAGPRCQTRTSVWVPPVPPPPLHPCQMQTQHVHEAETTIAIDGVRTLKIREMWKTTATVRENIEDMPFVPFSGRQSSIQQEIEERLVDPEEIPKPTINKLDSTPWHPEAPPIEPPTGEDCVRRKYWKQLEGPPGGQGNWGSMN